MFFLYKSKLWLQTLLATAGLGVAAGSFYDSSYVFLCPTDNDTLSFAAWPLDKQVVCAFTSLQIIRISYETFSANIQAILFYLNMLSSSITH